MHPLDIRPIPPDDADRYRALMLEAYASHPDAFTSSVDERRALPIAWWTRRLDGGPSAPERLLGAFVGERLAGSIGVGFDAREKARHKATLFGLYVPAPDRGRGIGRRLVEAAIDLARARPGIRVLQLTVTEGNDGAEALYRSCGFSRFGREPMAVAVAGGFVTKLHLWRTLTRPGPAP